MERVALMETNFSGGQAPSPVRSILKKERQNCLSSTFMTYAVEIEGETPFLFLQEAFDD